MLCVLFFFFQAEDGIRDAQESRGLGDVYKRQVQHRAHVRQSEHLDDVAVLQRLGRRDVASHRPVAVSYTHLTLPTIYSV